MHASPFRQNYACNNQSVPRSPNLSAGRWYILPQIFSTFAVIWAAPLTFSQGAWKGDLDVLDGAQYPHGFDSNSLPNALMVPWSGHNTVTYNDGLFPVFDGDGGVGLAMDPATPVAFRVEPAGRLVRPDPAEQTEFSLTIHNESPSLTDTAVPYKLKAQGPIASTRKLAIVPLRAPNPKTIKIYSVKLVGDNGMPVLNPVTNTPIAGLVDDREALQGALNAVFGSQANVRFEVLPAPAQGTPINYSHYADAKGALNTYPYFRFFGVLIPVPDLRWKEPFDAIAGNNGADFSLFYVSAIQGSVVGQAGIIGGKWAVIGTYGQTDTPFVPSLRRKTALHEIGHLLTLKHIFDFGENDASMLKIPEMQKDRLMDYGQQFGFRLIRKEWEMVNAAASD